ncbi:MAG: hypothetical protein ACJ8FL_00740 [Sphingomicrobium sp.]
MKFLTPRLLAAAALCIATASAAAPPDASAWTIGPVTPRGNHSRGVPLHPTPGPGRGWHIDLPGPGGNVNYVTFHHGSLAGKSRIVMRYRIEAAPGARVVPRTAPGAPSVITLYFQRRGDNWSGRGPFEAFRWYATFASQSPISAGEHVMVAPLSGNWTAVIRSSARTNPMAFREALAEADQVGFVLGGGDGYGHGVFATGPARLVVTDFRIE